MDQHGMDQQHAKHPDFFIWGYLKNWVYQDTPRNHTDHKNEIREEYKAIKP